MLKKEENIEHPILNKAMAVRMFSNGHHKKSAQKCKIDSNIRFSKQKTPIALTVIPCLLLP